MTIALLVAFLVSNLLWLAYLHGRDARDRDERAELSTRIQHPELVTPRAAVEYEPPTAEFDAVDEREYAGAVYENGIRGRGEEAD